MTGKYLYTLKYQNGKITQDSKFHITKTDKSYKIIQLHRRLKYIIFYKQQVFEY